MTQRILSIQNDQIPHNIPNSKHLHERPSKKNLDTVFQGTVASRVHQLQNHSEKISPEGRQNERDPSHESSYSRFGRRLAKRFSQPAQRNAKPSEETENEVTHSYTGTSISNTTIGKQHDLISARKRQGSYDKKDKVGTLAPKIGIQNDEPTSWIETYEIAPRNKGTTSLNPNADALLKAYHSTNNQFIPANNVPIVLPDLPNDDFRKLINKEEVVLRKRESDSSISTTSTIRRRSVRDLFTHHGIKRPPGLASSVKTHNIVGQNNQDSRKYCQQCSSTSKRDSIVFHDCKLHSNSHSLPTDNQISTAGPIKKIIENNITCDQNRQHLDIDSASFIGKSRRSRLSSIHPTDIPLKGDMKSDNNNNLPRKASQNLNKHKSTIGISNQIKKIDSTNPVPFLSGKNVTKSVKKSPFFARESMGITLPDHGPPNVTSKKISCGNLQLNSTSSQNMEPRYTPLRHCVSLSKTHQNQYQIDPQSEGLTKESYFQKNIADRKANPRHESLECYPAKLNPTRYVPNSKSLSTQNEAFEKSCVEIDHKKPSSLDANSFDRKQIDASMTCNETFSERNLSTQAKEIPAAYKATDGLGVLSRAKSVFARGGDRLARANSVSSTDAGINDTNTKHVASSPRNNNDLDEKRPGLSSLLHSEIDVDLLSKPELELSKVNPILGHQAKAAVGQEKSAKNDNESKKQRRLKIARKIKQSLPKSTDQKKESLGRRISGYQSDDNLHLTSMTTSEPSKQLIAGRWVDLPPINYRDHPSLWERSSDASLTDIAAQEIKGVTVTLQLEGRDDMVFKTKPLEVDIRENL